MYNEPDDYQTHRDEPEELYCEECGSSMTEETYSGVTWLKCDECDHVVYEEDKDE